MSHEEIGPVDVEGDNELSAALSAAQPGSPILRLFAMYKSAKAVPGCKPGTYTGPASRNSGTNSGDGRLGGTARARKAVDAARVTSGLPTLLDSVAEENAIAMSAEIGSQVYGLAKTRLAIYAGKLAAELRERLTDEEEAARELNIDPPDPGSPLARAFAANAALRRERDVAYAKGRSDAVAEFLRDVQALRERLMSRSAPSDMCKCGARRLSHSGETQSGHCEDTGCAGFTVKMGHV